MFFYEILHSDKENYIYNQYDKNLDFPVHLHNSYEFVYCFEGELTVAIDENSYILHSGECILIFPMRLHSYRTDDSSRSCLTIFSASFIGEFNDKYKNYEAENPIFKYDNIDRISSYLLSEGNIWQKKSVFYDIISEFCKNTKFKKYCNQNCSLVYSIVNYITEKYCDNISLKSMSKELGYSYNYLSSLCNQVFGAHFMDIVNNFRVDKVKQLLENKELSVTEIASRCGYNSLRSLNRNFKNLMKTCPSDYKQTVK